MFPALPLGFQASAAAGAEPKGPVVTFLREGGKRGPRPRREGAREEEWAFFFSLPAFTPLSFRLFS